MRHSWIPCAISLGSLIAWSMLNSGSTGLGVKGVGIPRYGVLLDAVARAMECRGWKLECACNLNVTSYLRAEHNRKGI